MIRPEKQAELVQRMQDLGVQDSDLEERFVLGSGKGGQKKNKTHSAVFLKHVPSGLSVKCDQERLREMNRFFARRHLCDLIAKSRGEMTKKDIQIAKIRKQKKRVKRRQSL